MFRGVIIAAWCIALIAMVTPAVTPVAWWTGLIATVTPALLRWQSGEQIQSAAVSGTDIWSRRSQCIQIGKKKLEKELIWYKGPDEAKWDWQVSVRTRYASDVGRCYVVIEGSANSGVSFTSLYDGQTDERLASANLIHKKEGGFDNFYGEVTEGGYFHELSRNQKDFHERLRENYAAAIDYINDRMTEKQSKEHDVQSEAASTESRRSQSTQSKLEPPTATELFQLRSRCAALAAKYVEDERNYKPTKEKQAYDRSLGPPGDNSPPTPVLIDLLSSHYDLKSGHCYVLMTRSYYTLGMLFKSLKDVQTNEALATTFERKNRDGTNYDGDVSDEKYELTWDRTSDQEHRNWDRAKYENANKYIKQKMSD
jgi:hypothetical protein